jgi:hypothetical protein
MMKEVVGKMGNDKKLAKAITRQENNQTSLISDNNEYENSNTTYSRPRHRFSFDVERLQ